jgi:uncharacterized lipoprotein YehR (DUF1307 family)
MTMKRGTMALLMAVALTVPLVGCDKAQTAGQGAAKKADTQAWQGVTAGPDFTASGYKAGDKTAWEAQLKARTERGQNEYTHVVSTKP